MYCLLCSCYVCVEFGTEGRCKLYDILVYCMIHCMIYCMIYCCIYNTTAVYIHIKGELSQE